MSQIKIAFFGTPRLAQIALTNIFDSPYKPSLVVTSPDASVGRGRQLTPSIVKKTAQELNLPIHTPHDLKDFSEKFDLAILVAYGKIIPQRVLDIPKFGFLNIHPSLLPLYRGPSPIQSAILNGDSKTGVTIIKLDEQIDHGPILGQKEISIENNDTHLSLIEKLGTLGSNLLLDLLPSYLSGKAELTEQEHQNATQTNRINKKDGFIELKDIQSEKNLNEKIRAFYPWPTVWTKLENGKILKLLPQQMVQPEGKKTNGCEEFFKWSPRK